MTKKIWGMAATTVLCLAFAGCNQVKGPVVKVGLIAELTGSIPAVGASCKNAAQLAVDEINNAGGVTIGSTAYRIQLIVEDSAAKPEQAAAAAQKLITQDNVAAIIGPNCSSNALPASEIAEKSKVVMITPWSTEPKTTLDARTGSPKQYVFRACFTDTFQGQVLGKFARETLKAKRAALLYDVGSDVLKSQAELFRQSFEQKGAQVVAVETYSTGDKDFSAQLTKIKNARPELIFLPSYYTDVPLQVQQAHRLGITVPFLGSDAWSTEELIKMAGKDVEGFYFCNHYAKETTDPAAQSFIQAYSSRYNSKPDDVAALTYDAFGLLKTALLKASGTDRESIHAALRAVTEYSGVTGQMRFTPGSGDPVKSAVIMQIKDGKFVFFAQIKP